ncbi:sugar porter family MFS transporter [Rheinheimera sp. SA_1]|uniref:sugar porter family MFS transporter n=1 Tax=Rheinheimera sp. SA_1 TaxID=1827365 RepID=UPI0009EE9D5A|nr:sugar porter family MFS transporter [Rheinheimera sp. SA_1]
MTMPMSAAAATSMTPFGQTGSVAYVLFISAIAAIGGFLFGFDSGVINGTVTALGKAFQSTAVATGFNVASVLLGCAVGALVAGPVADRFGRKPVMIVTAIVFAISAWGSGDAQSATAFILYRVFGGLGIGAASVLAPAYIAEVSPAALRGRLATLQQLAIVLGLFAAFVSNYLIASAAGSAENAFWLGLPAWRWMFWVELVPSVLFLLGVLFIPESPRYLVAQGKLEQARAVFRRISPGTEDQQLADVGKSLSGNHKPSIADLFIAGSSKLHPIIWVGIALSVFQQFVGINVVFYYGAELWQAAGFDESQSLFINVLAGTTNIVSTFIAIALIDKIGRKPLLLTGSIGMFVSLGVLTLIFGTAGFDAAGKLALTETMGTVALVTANLFVVFFGLSWGPVVWVLLGEIFNNRIRGAALAVAASAQWIANFAISMTFPILLGSVGLAGAYGFYTLSALISIFFVVKYIRETRGKTLEQME